MSHLSHMSGTSVTMRPIPRVPLTSWQAMVLLVERNVITYRAAWKLFLTGFLEPVLYLLSIGIGVGALIALAFSRWQYPASRKSTRS